MDSIQTAISEHLSRAFTVFIPYALQTRMDLLPGPVRHALLGELFRMAAQAGQEQQQPESGPVTRAFLMADCDVGVELDASRGRLTLVSLGRSSP